MTTENLSFSCFSGDDFEMDIQTVNEPRMPIVTVPCSRETGLVSLAVHKRGCGKRKDVLGAWVANPEVVRIGPS
jgi:hypothetical protein